MKQILLTKRYILLYAVIAGFLLALTPILLAFLPNRHGPSHQSIHILDATIVMILNIIMFFVSLWLNLRIVEKNVLKRVAINLVTYLTLCLLAIIVHRPVWAMLERLPIDFFIRDEFVRNFIIFSISALVASTVHSFQQNQLMKNKMLEIQRESLAGQIESLKQQINPHFFFNSLNTLRGLAQEDSKKTVEFIDKLSQVFRYVLDIQEKSMVSIAEEIHFANAYIYLLKVRFDTKFNVNIQVDLSAEVLVPSLCTQLLLENCFKHNSMSSEQPLNITISTDNEYLIIKNSISEMSNVAANRIGLKNLNERSKLLTGKAIEILNEKEFFTVKVPIIYNTAL